MYVLPIISNLLVYRTSKINRTITILRTESMMKPSGELQLLSDPGISAEDRQS